MLRNQLKSCQELTGAPFNIPELIAAQAAANAVIFHYVGWTGHDNIGDDILADIFSELLAENMLDLRGAFACKQSFGPATARRLHPYCDGYVLGGGSTIDRYYLDRVSPGAENGRPIYAFSAGIQARDWGLDPASGPAMGLFDSIRFGSVRGRLTREMLQPHCRVPVVPCVIDGGFIAANYCNSAPPKHSDDPSSPMTVALNCLDKPPDIELFAALIRAAPQHRYVLVPCDPATLAASRTVKSSAGEDAGVSIVEDYLDHPKVLQAFATADVSINMKLHASVLSASVLTPPLSLVGTMKFQEFFQSIETPDAILPSAELSPAGLCRALHAAAASATHFAQRTRILRDNAATMHRGLVAQFVREPSIAAKLAPLEQDGAWLLHLRGNDCSYLIITREADLPPNIAADLNSTAGLTGADQDSFRQGQG